MQFANMQLRRFQHAHQNSGPYWKSPMANAADGGRCQAKCLCQRTIVHEVQPADDGIEQFIGVRNELCGQERMTHGWPALSAPARPSSDQGCRRGRVPALHILDQLANVQLRFFQHAYEYWLTHWQLASADMTDARGRNAKHAREGGIALEAQLVDDHLQQVLGMPGELVGQGWRTHRCLIRYVSR